MIEPDPTPYDITDIPYFPYVPGVLDWVLLSLIAGALFLGYRWSDRIRRWLGKRSERAYRRLEREVTHILSSSEAGRLDKRATARAVLASKRFIETHCGMELSHLSEGELRLAASSCEAPALRQTMELMAELDNMRYQPAQSLEAAERIRRLLGLIDSHLRSEKEGR